MPETIILIGNYSFEDCDQLAEIQCLAHRPPELGREAIPQQTWIKVPRSARRNYKTQWVGHSKFTTL